MKNHQKNTIYSASGENVFLLALIYGPIGLVYMPIFRHSLFVMPCFSSLVSNSNAFAAYIFHTLQNW